MKANRSISTLRILVSDLLVLPLVYGFRLTILGRVHAKAILVLGKFVSMGQLAWFNLPLFKLA